MQKPAGPRITNIPVNMICKEKDKIGTYLPKSNDNKFNDIKHYHFNLSDYIYI